MKQHGRVFDKAVGRALGEATAKLQDEIATLRRELATARTEIKRLQSRDADDGSIVSWNIDRKGFRTTPFTANGKPGPTLNLRPLFEQYDVEVQAR